MTPEGRTKRLINKLLDQHSAGVYRFMPVLTGLGARTVDYLICAYGLFVAIEAKAPGKKPTEKQEHTLRRIREAGGTTFAIDGRDSLHPLEEFLDLAREEYDNYIESD